LGYVAVTEGCRAVHLKFRPRAVSQTTLAALLYWLLESSADRVAITYYSGSWQHEVMPIAAAPSRLGQLVIDPVSVRGGDFRRRRSTRRLRGPLHALLQCWRDDPGATFAGTATGLLNRRLGGRYMILKHPQWSRRLEILEVGRGFIVYDDDWLARAVGLRFEDQPDYLYAKWAADAYYEASDDARVIVDDIDALIERPRKPKARLQYQRLILPFRHPSGDRLLLCASTLDRQVNLRIEGS
jgi:hypothetical protein